MLNSTNPEFISPGGLLFKCKQKFWKEIVGFEGFWRSGAKGKAVLP